MKLHPLSLNDADNKLIVLSSEALFFTRPVSSNQIEDETLSLLNSSYSRGIHIRRWYCTGINATRFSIIIPLTLPYARPNPLANIAFALFEFLVPPPALGSTLA